MRSHPSVLVVDDSPTTCLFIASTLEQAGYDVDVALKGQEGLAKIAAFHPYCLILDVMLPDISGYAVCRQVQQSILEHQIYVILISAKNAPLDQSYGLRQGANRYLPKPFTAENLVQAVWEGVPGHLRQTVLPSVSRPHKRMSVQLTLNLFLAVSSTRILCEQETPLLILQLLKRSNLVSSMTLSMEREISQRLLA